MDFRRHKVLVVFIIFYYEFILHDGHLYCIALGYYYFMMDVIEVAMMKKLICKQKYHKFWKYRFRVGYLE